MAVEKVKYICASPAFLGRKQCFQEEITGLMARVARSLRENLGWLRLEYKREPQQIFYYNRNVRGLFPDLSKAMYTDPFFSISSSLHMNGLNDMIASQKLVLNGMPVSLIKKAELLTAFPSKARLEPIAKNWKWSPGLLNQYFAVLPCESGSEVCRVDGGCSTYWGADTQEKACSMILVHLANDASRHTWQDDVLFLMRKRFLPVLEDGKLDSGLLDKYEDILKREDGVLNLSWNLPEHSEDVEKRASGRVFRPTGEEQRKRLREELLECDHRRAGLAVYDDSILTPLNGHWDLWKYVQYNEVAEEQLPPPPPGKIWVDVSGENIYARNAADDLAPDAETVAVDFGTKSTTVARMDSEGNIVTVSIGEGEPKEGTGGYRKSGADAGDEKGYENPTILKYINLDRFRAAYGSAEGRPETRFDDLSASYTAERSFRDRTSGINDILTYQNQIKQWAYDNQFAPLVFDSHSQIKLKPYREIGAKDFDPIEAYAYLVGLTVVNMRRRRICTRYVLSYPPSYGADICEKMRQSFERGIRKAIPEEAQRTTAFQSGFSVLLRQSEPAAYAVCALREFSVEPKRTLCGVYDLGGGTVDYHFGVFTGDDPPYQYKSIQNGGNPRLGCENILEMLAYAVFSLVKEELRENKIPYEFPRQYAGNLEDMRYTSHSQRARFNTLGLVKELRLLWIRKFKPADDSPDELCYFLICSDSETEKEPELYLKIEAGPACKDGECPAKWEGRNGKELKMSLDPEFLKKFFWEKLAKTVWEFLNMQQTVRENVGRDLPLVIFLAGNGSQAPMVELLFRQYFPEFGVESCQLYPPLGMPEAEKGRRTKDSSGSIPNAKTGVAHGLLIALPGSDFIRITENHRGFMFRFHVGISRYDRAIRKSVFYRKKNAENFKCYEKRRAASAESQEAPFPIGEDGYLQIWYTDATLTQDPTPIRDCGAKQFLIRVPDAFLSEQPCGEVRGHCCYQAVSETELELIIRPIDQQERGYLFGILDLESGHFEPNSQDNAEK